MNDLEDMAKLSEYVYARKEYNWQSKPIANLAVLHSDYDTFRKYKQVYSNPLEIPAACRIVTDGGRPVDIVFDYHVLEDQLRGRKTLLLPEIEYVSEEMKKKLKEFAAGGGNLIICGSECCKLFGDMTPHKLDDKKVEILYTQANGHMYGVLKPLVTFEGENIQDICTCYEDIMDEESNKVSSVIVNPYGKGKVAFIGWNIISEYLEHYNFTLRDIMRTVLDTVEPQPFAYLEKGHRRVEIIPAIKEDKVLVNLINTTESHNDIHGAYDEIIPLTKLEIAVLCDKEPKKVMLQPEGIIPEYTYDGEYLHVKVENLEIHSIIVIEQ